MKYSKKHNCFIHRLLPFLLLVLFKIDEVIASDGCQFDPTASIFNQIEKQESPKDDWGWKWTANISIVPNTANLPIYKWMPDGHISSVKVLHIEPMFSL